MKILYSALIFSILFAHSAHSSTNIEEDEIDTFFQNLEHKFPSSDDVPSFPYVSDQGNFGVATKEGERKSDSTFCQRHPYLCVASICAGVAATFLFLEGFSVSTIEIGYEKTSVYYWWGNRMFLHEKGIFPHEDGLFPHEDGLYSHKLMF